MNQDKTLQDVLETVTFIKDNAATRGELSALGIGMKGELSALGIGMKGELSALELRLREHIETRLTEVKTELMTHIDSFIVLHQKLDTELTALRAKYDRLEGYLQQVAKHLQLNFQ